MLWICREISHLGEHHDRVTYLNETPYCDTASKPDFQTKVTSQEVVACSRHERKAEIALPPTAHTVRLSIMRCVKVKLTGQNAQTWRRSHRGKAGVAREKKA
jgi:hypothetical protein